MAKNNKPEADEVDKYIYAGVSGRIKAIFAEKDAEVADVMYENSSYVEIISGLQEGDTVYYTESRSSGFDDFGGFGGQGGRGDRGNRGQQSNTEDQTPIYRAVSNPHRTPNAFSWEKVAERCAVG